MSTTGTPSREHAARARPVATTAPVGWGTALAASVGVAAVYLLAVWTPAGQYVDDRLMTWSAATASDPRWADALLGDLVRAPLLLLVTAVVVSLAGLVHGVGRALAVAAVAGGSVLASQVLKAALDRPSLLDETALNSFPSGHVAAVAGLAAALVLAVPRVLRRLTVVLALPAVAAVGLATVVLEWHRPSDVIASVLIAVALAGLAEALTPGRRLRT